MKKKRNWPSLASLRVKKRGEPGRSSLPEGERGKNMPILAFLRVKGEVYPGWWIPLPYLSICLPGCIYGVYSLPVCVSPSMNDG